MRLAPLTLLQGRYRVHDLIAQGGMGAVYRAVDERLGHTVALKQTLMGDPHLRSAFEQEARLLASLQHPALPLVSDHFSEDGNQFLVMQFIPGIDLADALQQRNTPFELDAVLTWADQLLAVLEYLHALQPPVIHRDIKPQNLKINQHGDLVLLDFGLAKGVASNAQSIAGYTPRYAPLEQIQAHGTDARTDLYSAAATLYELLTATAPPDALSRAAALATNQPDPLEPAHHLNATLPPALSDLLRQMLALAADDRPSSAATVRSALRALRQPGPSSAGVSTLVIAPQTGGSTLPPVPPPPLPPIAATTPLPPPAATSSQSGTRSGSGLAVLLFGLGTLAILAIGMLGFAAISLFPSFAPAPVADATVQPAITVVVAPDPITTEEATAVPAAVIPPALPTPEPQVGTRTNPLPPDQPVQFGGWQITLREVIRGEAAWRMMRQANQFNPAPAAGMEYVLIQLDLRTTFSGDDERQLYPKLVGEQRNEYASAHVAPEPRATTTLPAQNASVGYLPFMVAANETNLLLKLEQLSGSDEPEPLFVALEAGNTLPDDPRLLDIQPNALGVIHREPAPLGSTAILEDWEVTVLEVQRGAAALERLRERYGSVAFPLPAADREYALASMQIRYIGADTDSVRVGRFNIDSVRTDDPNTPPTRIPSPPVYLVPEPALDHILFTGGTAEALMFRGNIYASRDDDSLNVRYMALE
jgi:serine/threonine protein kinase